MKAITLPTLKKMKLAQEKIAALTAYDASFSKILHRCGIDIILVGDTLGNIILGHKTTVPVTLEDICYHVAAVARGGEHAFLIADLPFMTYYSPCIALESAKQLMQAGAQMVKLEANENQKEIIQALSAQGIPVCAHLGLRPQSVHQLGGCTVQGRSEKEAETLVADAQTLVAHGADLLVLECIPQSLACKITQAVCVPTIGIGAGLDCDGQILVLYDMLGISEGTAYKFVHNFLLSSKGDVPEAITAYIHAVKSKTFPTHAHSFK